MDDKWRQYSKVPDQMLELVKEVGYLERSTRVRHKLVDDFKKSLTPIECFAYSLSKWSNWMPACITYYESFGFIHDVAKIAVNCTIFLDELMAYLKARIEPKRLIENIIERIRYSAYQCAKSENGIGLDIDDRTCIPVRMVYSAIFTESYLYETKYGILQHPDKPQFLLPIINYHVNKLSYYTEVF